MDRKKLEYARKRLRRAERAVDAMGASSDLRDHESEWFDFATAAKHILASLEQGAKVSPQSTGWFAEKKGLRKRDPLLQYIFQTRHYIEHEYVPTMTIVPSSQGISGGGSLYIKHMQITNGCITKFDGTHNGRPAKIEFFPERAQLLPVKDKVGNVYYPPEKHLGIRIGDRSPLGVATLALFFYQGLVDEAAELL